jgi:hypothetical protein
MNNSFYTFEDCELTLEKWRDCEASCSHDRRLKKRYHDRSTANKMREVIKRGTIDDKQKADRCFLLYNNGIWNCARWIALLEEEDGYYFVMKYEKDKEEAYATTDLIHDPLYIRVDSNFKSAYCNSRRRVHAYFKQGERVDKTMFEKIENKLLTMLTSLFGMAVQCPNTCLVPPEQWDKKLIKSVLDDPPELQEVLLLCLKKRSTESDKIRWSDLTPEPFFTDMQKITQELIHMRLLLAIQCIDWDMESESVESESTLYVLDEDCSLDEMDFNRLTEASYALQQLYPFLRQSDCSVDGISGDDEDSEEEKEIAVEDDEVERCRRLDRAIDDGMDWREYTRSGSRHKKEGEWCLEEIRMAVVKKDKNQDEESTKELLAYMDVMESQKVSDDTHLKVLLKKSRIGTFAHATIYRLLEGSSVWLRVLRTLEENEIEWCDLDTSSQSYVIDAVETGEFGTCYPPSLACLSEVFEGEESSDEDDIGSTEYYDSESDMESESVSSGIELEAEAEVSSGIELEAEAEYTDDEQMVVKETHQWSKGKTILEKWLIRKILEKWLIRWVETVYGDDWSSPNYESLRKSEESLVGKLQEYCEAYSKEPRKNYAFWFFWFRAVVNTISGINDHDGMDA